jgi:arabinose-5-phosphate isomerase
MQANVSTIQEDAAFGQVISAITCGCQEMVAVNNTQQQLVGIITDGDLRHYIHVKKCTTRQEHMPEI